MNCPRELGHGLEGKPLPGTMEEARLLLASSIEPEQTQPQVARPDDPYESFRQRTATSWTTFLAAKRYARQEPGGEDRLRGRCNLCGDPGHYARDCRRRL
ncbi:hypothetical protein FOZ62_026035 [Perkinsus olseni]|uniref:CCHC-type domain-containing protein n=1 Tax=Perkinsus olseni TaxID=32597 RepID=A0A7J6R7E6_PEROL|nr:hypothetical protein FOZ62_026035 [Perkinsus olseni]